MSFLYTYDQVVEAIASTRRDGAHYFLTQYLHRHETDVGAERFRRLLDIAKLRGQDLMRIHIAIARLDTSYAAHLPSILRSASSIEAQQVLLAALPEVLPRGKRDSTVADQLEAWLHRRLKRSSYWNNYAIWEIPSVLLAVLHSTDSSRARALMTQVQAFVDDDSRRLAHAAAQSTDDVEFAAILKEWCSLNSVEVEPDEEYDAETEREAAKYMRRLGFRPQG